MIDADASLAAFGSSLGLTLLCSPNSVGSLPSILIMSAPNSPLADMHPSQPASGVDEDSDSELSDVPANVELATWDFGLDGTNQSSTNESPPKRRRTSSCASRALSWTRKKLKRRQATAEPITESDPTLSKFEGLPDEVSHKYPFQSQVQN